MAAMVVLALPLVGRILVWAVVLGGLAIFIYRRLKGVPLTGPKKVATPADPPSPSPDPFGAVPPPMGATELTAPTGPMPPTMRPSPSDPATAAGGGPVPPAMPIGTSARAGFFSATPAAAGPEGGPGAEAPASRPTVAEAVRGIAMPCGLAPVVDGSSSIPNPFRVLFLTTTAPAAEVGRGLADELERLGFSLATTTPTELVARRQGAELRVVLFPSPATVTRGLEVMFPAAPPGSVGVELST